jgi:hypothetical protein
MNSPATADARAAAPGWREVAWPKEHGSWSLAFEPVLLGLIAAPSAAGGALALAVVAAFFARRPLRIAALDATASRREAARRAVIGSAMIAIAGMAIAVALAGAEWWPWLLPSIAGGVVFLYFDLRKAGREQSAELAGTFAFGWLPAVFAAIGGADASASAALGALMLARAVPTVLTVRASLRARKTGERRVAIPLVAAGAACVAAGVLSVRGEVPWTATVLLGVLAVRSVALLVFLPRTVRATTIGIAESVLGAIYVLAVGIAWSL